MTKFVFGMNQSLDGFVNHTALPTPSRTLFRHYVEQARAQTGSVYGRHLYELMRYWDEDRPEWDEDHRAFAAAWRKQPKWVVSRSLKSVGPNATLVSDDIGAILQALKDRLVGEIQVGGPHLARSLTALGLVDEYRLYVQPVVLGEGLRFFFDSRPPLRLVSSDRIDEDVILLTYASGESRR
ncbi:MAG: dihydrofolate reductase family protein [Phycisphaerales bacterium]|nr:dihydrofolate reductase family protein [Phycisphaerales bacterium]